MTELKKLIYDLEEGFKVESKKYECIKHPKKLVQALNKLDRTTGMKTLKYQVTREVQNLIVRMRMGKKHVDPINIMVTGPPGVGKSKVGVILAEILYGVGYLETEKVQKKGWFNVESDNPNLNSEYMIILISGLVLVYGAQMLGFLYNKISFYYFSIFLALLLFIGLLIFLIVTYSDNITYYLNEYEDDEDEDNRKCYVLVGKETFISGFMGQSITQTKAWLKNNKKVAAVFDECYSIVADGRDSYGTDVLTLLNKDMEENPTDRVWIWCGYPDKIQLLFRYQPGLDSRFTWKFNIPGYIGDELFEIFESQLDDDGWRLKEEDRNDIKLLFNRNSYLFKSFGRDTRRLRGYSNRKNTASAYYSGELDINITYEHVKSAMETLRNNQIDTEPKKKKSLQEMLEDLNGDDSLPY